MSDAFGRAIRDHHRGERSAPLLVRDGDDTEHHPIEQFYFEDFDGEGHGEWLESWLDGPLLDLGAGTGRHALYFQERFETVAIDPSDALVETMRERGVEDAHRGDMFDLRPQFERDRFQSALAIGTQICLAGSMDGLRQLLADLAHVTTADATAVVHSYDPAAEGVEELVGYRADPTPGLAHRVMTFEYEGETSEILQFRLFGPERLREATVPTPWSVEDVVRPGWDGSYRAALAKTGRRS
ncbi:class I SAM-dependent methyltransferase [Halomicrobium katesii]|uniref:class I SAM-dependent methyltransferase n=1 Tax=Halomicrobium katesii TaxID=437163 RepID=UPI00037BC332|nr:class I SAM-dependent methyltransferase [Halomicrobium katesii]